MDNDNICGYCNKDCGLTCPEWDEGRTDMDMILFIEEMLSDPIPIVRLD